MVGMKLGKCESKDRAVMHNVAICNNIRRRTVHRFNFARKPDKKYQLHSIILRYTNPKAEGRSLIWLQLWNKSTNLKLYQSQVLNFSSSSDLLSLFFTAGLPCIPLLSITFFTIEQGGPQNSLFVFIQTPYHPCGVFRCSFIRDPVCISKMRRN